MSSMVIICSAMSSDIGRCIFQNDDTLSKYVQGHSYVPQGKITSGKIFVYNLGIHNQLLYIFLPSIY